MKLDTSAKFAWVFAAACVGLIQQPASSLAADWPARPVTVVVPFSAGGITDTMARIMGSYLSAKFHQPFVIDNRDGASGAIAAEAVAHANPDGYTLLLGATPQISIVPYMQHVKYDPKKDLIPTSIFGTDPFVMMVRSDLPVKTTQEFIDYAKARPGKLTFASGGNATISRLSASLFLTRAGLELIHVPYRGGAPAMVDMLGHHVDMYFGSAVDIAPVKDDPRIRLLAVIQPDHVEWIDGACRYAAGYRRQDHAGYYRSGARSRHRHQIEKRQRRTRWQHDGRVPENHQR
jgi:tripartite-type tricarboxylate transporter receptor subunit TctC